VGFPFDDFTRLLLIFYSAGVVGIIAGGFVIALKKTRALPSSSSLPYDYNTKPTETHVIEPKIMSRDIKVSQGTETKRVKRLIYREGESPWEEEKGE